MTGYHTRWARPQDAADDPERIAIREALAFGKALYDIRTALGLTVAELAIRAALTDDDIERIEEGGTIVDQTTDSRGTEPMFCTRHRLLGPQATDKPHDR